MSETFSCALWGRLDEGESKICLDAAKLCLQFKTEAAQFPRGHNLPCHAPWPEVITEVMA